MPEDIKHIGEKKLVEKPKQETFERDYSRYDFKYPTDHYTYISKPGLSRGVVEEISRIKNEPDWMREFRLQAYDVFMKKPLPMWGADLTSIDFDTITYYARPTDEGARSWDDVPEEIKKTFDRLGIPEAERKFLAGVGAQYDCLTADTIVFANPGAVPIAQIQPGQLVYSLDLNTRSLIKQRVLGVIEKGELPVFEVKVAGRRLKATFNHPFLALVYHKDEGKQRGHFEVQWRYLSDLKAGDHIAIVKQLPDEGQPYRLPRVDLTSVYTGRNQIGAFPVRTGKLFRRTQKNLRIPQYTSEALMWFLGAYLGDGGLRRKAKGKSKTYVDIAFPTSDQPCRQKLAEVLREAFGYNLCFDKEPYRVRIRCVPIVRLLSALGLDAHAKTKFVPAWAFSLPRSQKLAFIAGYIDSDGHVRGDERTSDAILTSVNERLLRDVQRLAITCGLRVSNVFPFCSKATYKGKTTERTAYRLMLMGDLQPLIPYSVKVAANYAPRKYHHRYNSHHGSKLDTHTSDDIGFAPIESIRYLGFEPTYDIEVQGAHNFVAEGVVVHNSEVVYHSIREDLKKKGVIFLGMDDGLKEYPEIVKEYFGTVIPKEDNKFAALNSAVWSGGSFIYVPPGVQVEIPLQAYFRINAANMGQFERTLIIADEGARVHYIEGCLPAGEQVSLGDRWVNIERLKPGDFVIAGDGRKARVRAVMVRPYHGEMLTIRPISPYNAFRLTPEHPVLVVRRKNVLKKRKQRNGWLPEVDTKKLSTAEPEYVPAGELEVGDFLVFPKVQPEGFNSKYTPELLKLLGYYLAEGSAFVNQALNMPVVSFSLGADEADAIAEVLSLIRQITGKKAHVAQLADKHAVNITVYSQKLMELCLEACGKGAATKRLSEELMALPPEQIEPLLTAYFRGDGNVCDKGNSVMYRAATASEALAQQLQELLASKGIYASIQVRRGGEDTILGRAIHRQDQYIVVYTADKRCSEIRATDKYFLVPIKGIERAPYDGFVFNLDVEGPNSYLVRGFVAHNCTAPVYSRESLHSAVVELIAKRGAHLRYTTLQNWSNDVYNLVTKRAVAYEDATVEWVDANIGSRVTMKFPSVYMLGKGAKADILSVAYAGKGQHQDTGGKAIHAAPYTTSTIISKSVSKGGGRTTYRGQLKVIKGAVGAKSSVRCDALLLDEHSRSDTYPYIEIDEDRVTIGHEATVGKVGEDQIFYLMSRGLSEGEALSMIVLGFMEPFTKTLPMEYAVEFNRLIQLEMSGSVG